MDGSSPELPQFKQAADAPKASSSSSLREKPLLPNTEAAPNASRHPSETFPWPERDAYFRGREQFIKDNYASVFQRLTADPKFAFADNPELAKTYTTLFLQAYYVYDLMEKNNPSQPSPPIWLSDERDFTSKRSIATTRVFFYRGDTLLETKDWHRLAPTDAEQMELREIGIAWNMDNLADEISDIHRSAAEAAENAGIPIEGLKEWEAGEFAKVGIVQERYMVEEMAHAFYIINKARSGEGRKELIEEINSYPSLPAGNDAVLLAGTEEALAYKNAPSEQDGDKWVEAFIAQYYPNIDRRIVSLPEQKLSTP